MNYYWIAFSCLVRKEIRRFIQIWQQTLLPPAMTTVLYFLVFGEVMGAKIGSIDGFLYTTFIAPGLIMLVVITNSYSNVVGSFYASRFNRSIEELLVSPMPNWMIIGGYVSGGIARGILTGAIVTLISLMFTHYHIAHFWLSFILIILCSLLFSLVGLLNGIFARNFDDLVIVPTFVLTPLIYLGGVFFSVKSLNLFWQSLSCLNPVHYLIDSFRYSLLGIAPNEPVWAALVGILIFICLLYVYVYHLMLTGKRIKN